jgi:hypothetical protein
MSLCVVGTTINNIYLKPKQHVWHHLGLYLSFPISIALSVGSRPIYK